jgi:hypothetical protein
MELMESESAVVDKDAGCGLSGVCRIKLSGTTKSLMQRTSATFVSFVTDRDTFYIALGWIPPLA